MDSQSFDVVQLNAYSDLPTHSALNSAGSVFVNSVLLLLRRLPSLSTCPPCFVAGEKGRLARRAACPPSFLAGVAGDEFDTPLAPEQKHFGAGND